MLRSLPAALPRLRVHAADGMRAGREAGRGLNARAGRRLHAAAAGAEGLLQSLPGRRRQPRAGARRILWAAGDITENRPPLSPLASGSCRPFHAIADGGWSRTTKI